MTAEEAYKKRIQAIKREGIEIKREADAMFALSADYNTKANEVLRAAGFTPSGGGGTSGSSAAANAAEAERKRLKEMQEQLAKDAEDARTDATIAAMAEGLKKEKAAINANYDEKAQLINEREAELKKMQKGKLTEQQVADFQALRDRNEQLRKEEIKAAEDAAEKAKTAEDAKTAAAKESWNEYLIAYGTFQERLKATQDKYAAEIANAKNDGEKKMLEAERDAILAEFAVEAEGFGKELVSKTTEELSKMIEQLRAQVEAKQEVFDALDSSESTSAQAYREEINKLNAQIKVLQGLLGKAKKEVKDDNWADATQVFQNISQAANNAAEGLAEFDEGAANILRTMGQLAGSAINLIGAIQAVKTATTALAAVSGVLGAIGAAIQAVGSIFNIIKAGEEAARNATIAANEYAQAIERISNAERTDPFSTIFGKDKYGEFTTLLNEAKSQLQDIAKLRSDIAKTSDNAVNELSDGASVWANLGGLRDKINEGYAYDEVLVADMRNGWQKFWGSGNDQIKYTSLDEFFENGKLNLDKLKAYYNSYKDYLTDEQADLIESLINTGELLEENMQAVTAYLTDIFGELGQEINDAIVDAFANGTDAAVAFGDVAGKMLENLISQIGYTAYIAPILSKAMADVEALNGQNLSAEDYLNALMGIVSDTMKAAEGAVDGYNEFLERSDRMAEEQGINTFNGERTAAAKGIAQASQDSVDEMNGRLTAIQSHTFSLVEGQKQLINDSAQALTYLAGIESNTAHLEQMRYDMGAMRKDISDMATRGIVTR